MLKMVHNFHICLRSGPRWLTPSLMVGLTVKYLCFFWRHPWWFVQQFYLKNSCSPNFIYSLKLQCLWWAQLYVSHISISHCCKINGLVEWIFLSQSDQQYIRPIQTRIPWNKCQSFFLTKTESSFSCLCSPLTTERVLLSVT